MNTVAGNTMLRILRDFFFHLRGMEGGQQPQNKIDSNEEIF
jgi:hypothetical protein